MAEYHEPTINSRKLNELKNESGRREWG